MVLRFFILMVCVLRLCAADVVHTPAQPKSGEAVTITARLNAGAGNVMLHVQVAEPGKYVRKTDPAFTNSWRSFPMSEQGGAFVATIPAAEQQHRRLIRYYVSFAVEQRISLIPLATNDSPNFAYFVYDGLPAWTGASRPGQKPIMFSAEFMKTLPAYHLIARREEVEASQWDGGANKKRFFGTMVYEGRVYDHIQFHNRGKASTHVAGKNKWGFRFNESEPFPARDLWGRPYTGPWNNVSLTACASPWAPVNRGMAGMDEAVSFRAYQLAGVPSANTHWIQFRVVSGKDEAPANNQYAGDLWGLYQVVQEPNGDWLRERGLPDGDVYSPESGAKYRPKGSPTNDVAFQQFMQGSQQGSSQEWWRANMNLPRYYTFHALNRVLANVDVRPGANHYLYRAPDGHWTVIPWDLDMMFIAKTHQPGFVDQSRCLQVRELKVEYQNRAREVLDLFCSDTNANGGQVAQLVDEMAQFLMPRGFERNWAELDMCVWNYHPRSNAKGQFYVTPYRDGRFGGEWTRTLATPDFSGFCKYITEFCTDSRPEKNYAINDGDQRGYGFGYLSVEARSRSAPEQPRIKVSGGGVNKQSSVQPLMLEISEFKSPPDITNTTFAAMQWRVAEISAPGLAGYKSGEPRKYEIEELWRSEELAMQTNRFSLPLTMCRPERTYRVRARYKNNMERWSRWSEPVQFVTSERRTAIVR